MSFQQLVFFTDGQCPSQLFSFFFHFTSLIHTSEQRARRPKNEGREATKRERRVIREFKRVENTLFEWEFGRRSQLGVHGFDLILDMAALYDTDFSITALSIY